MGICLINAVLIRLGANSSALLESTPRGVFHSIYGDHKEKDKKLLTYAYNIHIIYLEHMLKTNCPSRVNQSLKRIKTRLSKGGECTPRGDCTDRGDGTDDRPGCRIQRVILFPAALTRPRVWDGPGFGLRTRQGSDGRRPFRRHRFAAAYPPDGRVFPKELRKWGSPMNSLPSTGAKEPEAHLSTWVVN